MTSQFQSYLILRDCLAKNIATNKQQLRLLSHRQEQGENAQFTKV